MKAQEIEQYCKLNHSTSSTMNYFRGQKINDMDSLDGVTYVSPKVSELLRRNPNAVKRIMNYIDRYTTPTR